MKIVITAAANGRSEQIDARFGRAQGFFVIDTDTDGSSYIDNSEVVEAEHGAGTTAAQSVIGIGAKIVITGHVGPKAGSVLKTGGVKVLKAETPATIEETYTRFKRGELKEQSL